MSQVLEIDLICQLCGSINDASFTASGPHIKATCDRCGRYIKFVSFAQADYVRRQMHDKLFSQKFNDMIKTQLIGKLGKDAEVRDISGTKPTKVINFSVAVDTGYGDKKTTLWVECAKFGENTGVAPYLKKGTQVHVAGEPGIRQWESNGKSGVSFTLRVDTIELLGGNKPAEGSNESTSSSEPKGLVQAGGNIVIEDDLPF